MEKQNRILGIKKRSICSRMSSSHTGNTNGGRTTIETTAPANNPGRTTMDTDIFR